MSVYDSFLTCTPKYRLRAADAAHLATAVLLGADRFITNNRRDVDERITEVDVTYPSALPEPTGDGPHGVTSA